MAGKQENYGSEEREEAHLGQERIQGERLVKGGEWEAGRRGGSERTKGRRIGGRGKK